MSKTMIGMKIFEMTPSGKHEVIEIETERLDNSDDQKEVINSMIDMIFKNEGMWMSFQDRGFVIRGLASKTITIESVYADLVGEFERE